MESAKILFLLLVILNNVWGKELCLAGNCTENETQGIKNISLIHNSWHDLNENEMFGTICHTSIKGDYQKSKWYWEARFWCLKLSDIKGVSKKQKSRNDAIDRAVIDYIQKGEERGFLTENHLGYSSNADSNTISLVNNAEKSRHARGITEDLEKVITTGALAKVYNNGIYKGDIVNDAFHGAGVYTWNSGAKYIGAWRNGHMHGIGIYRFTNGSWYVGEFKNNEINGYGNMLYTKDYQYAGDFVNGERHGFGKETWEDGSKYLGQFQNNKRHGFGYWIHADGKRKAALYISGIEV